MQNCNLNCPDCKQELLQTQPKVRVLLIDYSLKYLFCHQDCNIDDVIDNHFTKQMELVKSQLEKEVQICTNCEENGTAVSYCVDCSEWLCGACVIAHQRVGLTKRHNIQSKENVDLQSASSLPKLLRCSIHKENNESRLICCMTCESLTEVGTHCQHCTAPVAQESNPESNPKKIAGGMDEGPRVLEKEASVSVLVNEYQSISEDEIDRTLIYSSDDEYYPAKKRPKRKCKKSPVHDPLPLASLRGKGRGRGRPSSVKPLTAPSTSVVKEDNKHSDSPQTSNEKQDHTSSLPSKTTPVNLGNFGDIRELSLTCRGIRIGCLKTVPQQAIYISLSGIEMLVTNPKDSNTASCNIIIPSKDIVQIMCHFGRSLPIMYVYTNTRFSEEIVKKFGKEIYSPSGQDESKKRIIILPEKFEDQDRLIIKNIFKDISVNQKRHNLFAELDVKSANALLVGCTPLEKKK